MNNDNELYFQKIYNHYYEVSNFDFEFTFDVDDRTFTAKMLRLVTIFSLFLFYML